MSIANGLVFLSWGGESSEGVAAVLQGILRDHFSLADVFFSPISIDVGDDPMERLFKEGLFQATALVAAKQSPIRARPADRRCPCATSPDAR